MPLDALAASLAAAGRAAFTQARTEYPDESFYCFALFTDALATYVHATCCGEQGLRDTAAAYAESGGGSVAEHAVDLRWSPCDSPYDMLGEEHFDRANELLGNRPDPYDLDDEACEAEVAARFEACFQALAQLDAEGFFGRGADRERVVVTVWQGDESERSRLASVQRLNPPAVAERFARDLDIPQPLGDFVTLGSRGAYQITAVVHARDAGLLVACGSGGEWFAWELNGGHELVATEDDGAHYWDAAISADGRALVLAGHDRLRRAEPPGPASRDLAVPGGWRVAVAPDGAMVAAHHDGGVQATDLASGRLRWRLDHPACCLRFSPDGTLLAVAGDGGDAPGVVLVDAADGSVRQELLACARPSRHCLAWSPDGQALATADTESGRMRTWYRRDGRWYPGEEFELPGAAASGDPLLDAAGDLAFSPNGTLLASAHHNGDVHVWDAATGAHRHRLRGVQEAMHAVVFLDDDHLAAGGRDVDCGPPVYVWTL